MSKIVIDPVTRIEGHLRIRGVDFHAAHMRGLNDGSRRLLRASS
jgi:hypothetical protein